ncbi:Pathogenesis-related protein STH-2 [Vitis vinifera]|uniref:Pathogenesis-related protein STH-2 n=1 Tax=Vitis vinifera TaxID=29760 RepID=A0A438FJ07_VITVI|nr:Pathogenesis-related protein STH-2 [Vitis vinifera]
MGVVSFAQESESPVAPGRLFKALILDSHNLCPKLMPQWIKSIDIIQGDGGVGTIKQTNFTRDEFMDDGEGGSICRMLSEYETVGDVVFRDEDIEEGKEKATELFKPVEAFLLANLDAYA